MSDQLYRQLKCLVWAFIAFNIVQSVVNFTQLWNNNELRLRVGELEGRVQVLEQTPRTIEFKNAWGPQWPEGKQPWKE